MNIKDRIKTAEPIAKLDELTREKWKKLRKTGIGGSDAGAVMGLSKYSSPLSLCMEKTGRLQDDDEGNDFTEFGNILENPIRHEVFPHYYQKETGRRPVVISPKYMWRSVDHSWQLANVDGWIIDEGRLCGLEIKTGSSYVLKDWGGKDGDEVPDSYYCQVQHYMATLGIDMWVVFGVIGNNPVLRFVPRNDVFITGMIEAERHIWDAVSTNDPLQFPAPMGLDADMDALMALSDPQSGDMVDIVDDLLKQYDNARKDEKAAKEEKEYYKQQIIKQMGNAKYATDGRYKATFTKSNVSRLDTKAIKKDYPDISEKYTKKKEEGRLMVKELKE